MSIESLLIHSAKILRPRITEDEYGEKLLEYGDRAKVFYIKGRVSRERNQLISDAKEIVGVERTILFFLEFDFAKYDRVEVLGKSYELNSMAYDYFDSVGNHHRKIELEKID
jgi:hypothetical protein